MNKKCALGWLGLVSCLAWIPLSITAFFMSPVTTDIKLAIAAGASFITMLIFWMKEEG